MSSTPSSSSLANGHEPALADLVRILDVAAEMRADRELASREFAVDETRKLLRERLLASARLTGDPVTPAEVDAAIEQYFQSLYTFREPRGSFSLLLAHVYVRRAWVALAGAALLMFVTGSWALFNSSSGLLSPTAYATRQVATLVASNTELGHQLLASSNDPTVKSLVEAELANLKLAAASGDRAALDEIRRRFVLWKATLAEEYEIRIVADSKRQSGVRRDFEDKDGKRVSGYYLIVEARTTDGRVVPRPIVNAETQKTETVNAWGEQVPQAVYERIRDDKKGDGILNETRFAVKRRGQLTPEIVIHDAAGQPIVRKSQITKW
ncbi:MAG: hypothetical protein JNM18_15385 [Planctomycetaceae bacterium]|nr:hypothetical protein [Planctomycetaceae bacterium]